MTGKHAFGARQVFGPVASFNEHGGQSRTKHLRGGVFGHLNGGSGENRSFCDGHRDPLSGVPLGFR
jgi:hypothetical protein